MQDRSLPARLKRLFSTDVVIRSTSAGQLKVADVDNIMAFGTAQTNSLVDRFTRLHKAGHQARYNPNMNYQTLRIQLYSDYEAMDTDGIISSVLDIIADECTLKGETGEILGIRSSNENIQKILYNLFYDVLNIEFNLPMWIRSMCKYGDAYLKLSLSEKYGIFNVKPLSVYDIIREEGIDIENPNYICFRVDPMALAGGNPAMYDKEKYENYEIAHFRLNGDTNFLPYGRSFIEPARKLFKQLTLMEDAFLIHRIMRSPEKRIFYINVGNIPPNEVDNFVQKTINNMKKTPYIDPQTGDYNLKFNMQNMTEDFFIPIRGNDQTTRIDTAKGLEYTGMDDVLYLQNKMLAALKVPKAFLNYSDELNGKCLHPDTKIPLLTGEEKTIKEIADLFESQEDPNLWVYSYDKETNSVIPGKVVLAKKTRLDAKLVKVNLDNGEYIISTPDHNFILRGGEKIQAQYLKEGDSLQAIYRENRKIRNQQNTYEHVYQPNSGKWQPTHKMVDLYMNGIIENNGYNSEGVFDRNNMLVVHHKDFNRYNNHPDNLQRCTFREHSDIHIKAAEKGIWTENAKKKAKETKNTEEYRIKASKIGKGVMEKRCEKDPYSKYYVRDAWRAMTFEQRSELVRNRMTEKTKEKLRESGKKTYSIHGENLQKAYKEKFKGQRPDLWRENNVKWVNRPEIGSIISFIENYKGDIKDINQPKKLAKMMGYSLHVFEDAIRTSGWDIEEFFNEYTGFVKGRHKYIRREYLIELLSGCDSVSDFVKKYKIGRKAIKLFKNILGESLSNYTNKTYNHKVVSVEFLDYTSDTYNMEVYDKNQNHNFLTSAGVVVKNSTISALDVSFSRTIERIQKIIVSELTKIAMIHLYIQGYEDADLVNFELNMHNPSIIYEQEKIALLKEKVDLAGQIMEKKLMSSDWIYDKVFEMSDDSFNAQRDLIVEDAKRAFRLNQIETEGNDPVVTGESYGTPHDLASLYGQTRYAKPDVPDGYDETQPVGRPKEKSSIIGTDDSAFGRDPLGKKGAMEPYKAENPRQNQKISAIALENQRQLFLNKSMLENMPYGQKPGKKVLLFENQKEEQINLLDESNIKDLG